MHVEHLPRLDNVIRFPLERRVAPSIDLVRAMAPDAEEVISVAESFGLDTPNPTLRAMTDERAADHIENFISGRPPEEAAAALTTILAPFVDRAIKACTALEAAGVKAAAAQRRLSDAQIETGYVMSVVEREAEGWTRAAAERLVEAHRCCEEAIGVTRAVEFARAGKVWFALTADAMAEWLCEAENAEKSRLAS